MDVDGDPALAAAYGDEVPVLLVNGRKAFKYRVDRGARCALASAREPRVAPRAGHRGRRDGRRHRPGRGREGGRRRLARRPTSSACWSATSARIQAVLEHGVRTTPSTSRVLHARDAIGDGRGRRTRRCARTSDASLLVARARGGRGARRRARVGGQHRRLRPRVRASTSRCCRASGARRSRASTRGRPSIRARIRSRCCSTSGATVRCEADELVQFALMGSAYARRISKVPSPRVGLLNMGARTTRAATRWSRRTAGCARSRRSTSSATSRATTWCAARADVIVCEGCSATSC